MTNQFKTLVLKKNLDNFARVIKVTTAHGDFLTPCFMPVGTRAFVNHVTPHDLLASKSQIILGGNTYHMLCLPGLESIQKLGGMHRLMGWDLPMLTDSGGFQVFSLSKNSKICKIGEDGASFKHPITGSVIHLTPQSSIDAQKVVGADIIMAFDECTPELGGFERSKSAMERTHRWLIQSREIHDKNPYSVYGYAQALFGIIQGGSHRELREESAKFVVNMDLEGIAIGGEVIGYDMDKTCQIIDWVRPFLPEDKICYTMGVGLAPQDLLDVISKGVDIFDCVAPTRNARHGSLYCGRVVEKDNWLVFENTEQLGKLLIKKAIYARDERPIVEGCGCYTCLNFTRAYLHYLFKIKSSLYSHLACIHNVYVMNNVCEKARNFIIKSC